MNLLKDIIRYFVPPVFIDLAKRLFGARYGHSGEYRSWHDAVRASSGYDNDAILRKTKAALLKVKNDEAVYERDSVLFDEIQYAWPLLAGMMWVAARCGSTLNVLDFGGSLGSTYFQNRAFLCALPHIRWNIVEQPKYVKVGKECFEDEQLRFYPTIEHYLSENKPNLIILSSVLQYLEYPFKVLDELMGLCCEHIIIDRTPFWVGPSDRLCVQTVPPSIYPASYPSWIFSTPRFHAYLNEKWQIIAEFDSFDGLSAPVKAVWKGFILERRKHVIWRI